MLGLNQMKKIIYLAVFLVGFSFSSSAWSNAEVSAHFGMKFGSKLNLQEVGRSSLEWVDQKNMPLHFGADVLYRHMMNDTGSFGVGLRYRFALTGEKDFDNRTGRADDDDKYKFTHHRVALLLNYRFHIDQFFVGPVLGVDVWKSLMFSIMNQGDATGTNSEVRSRQFLWNQITGQAGLEFGYNVTDNFLVKLEAGYDLSSFGDLKCKQASNVGSTLTECTNTDTLLNVTGTGEDVETEKLKLSGFYATLGIGWFFG